MASFIQFILWANSPFTAREVEQQFLDNVEAGLSIVIPDQDTCDVYGHELTSDEDHFEGDPYCEQCGQCFPN